MTGWLFEEQFRQDANRACMKNTKFFDTSSTSSSAKNLFSAEQEARIAKIESDFVRLEKSISYNNKRISDWFVYFESALARLNLGLKQTESDRSNSSGKADMDLVSLKKDLAESLDNALAIQMKELESFKQALKQELEVFVRQIELKQGDVRQIQPVEPISNVTNANNISNIMPQAHYNVQDGLSNPEKWLIGVLFNAEAPLSYSQISERTGKSVSTARVYMNQLKIKGFVEESSLPNGIKIFSLKHDAKVKKLYNL